MDQTGEKESPMKETPGTSEQQWARQPLLRETVFDDRIENLVRNLEGRRYRLPDGSERFLVDEPMFLRAAERLGGTWIEPLKTTVVQNQRSMTTWVLRSSEASGSRW